MGDAAAGAGEEEALLGLEPVPPERTVAYGRHPSQVVDFYGTDGFGPRVTVLHGGYWREAYDRTHLSAFAAALAARGMAVELVEYRRVGGGGGWPETPRDIGAALDHLGTPNVLLGHSAGGHLALWAASQRERAADRVVAVAPVADLARAHQLQLSNGAVSEFLGGDDAVPKLLPDADPMRLPPRVPVEILHGTADVDVPLELSRRYANDWGARLHVLTGAGHFAPFTPGTPAFGVLADALS
ncbi:alpha/beta hydrolase family protein [Streptomyces marispadix]|uniref:Alpha/beta hydrolase n=1 Tax=Streptomyces marispadix TaxID=2922868 RepID=A0ABS9SYG6_9ACTN|nr:alpha/beta hydrolase [Streptomyces marispadix]MCH6161243.1 alpha/beta hydrolase [Streptomyces marispadix]